MNISAAAGGSQTILMKTNNPPAGGANPTAPVIAGEALQTLQLACELQRSGRHAEAEEAYRGLLLEFPDAAPLHYNLGLLLYQQRRYEESLEQYLQAMDGPGEDPDLLYNLSLCLKQCGRPREAVMVCRAMLDISPLDGDGLYHLAGCLRELGEHDESADTLVRLLALQPDHLPAIGSLACLRQVQGRMDEACSCYQRLQDLDPGNLTASHMVAALRGEQVATAPDDYVRAVFNGYADGFEASLVESLGYCVPEELRRGVDLLTGGERRFSHLLDLGCGTGLVGEAFRDICSCATGVDIAGEMIAITREKGVYDHLTVAGILPFLEETAARYDLVALADVLIYLGDPGPVLAAIGQVASDDALLCFSVETDAVGTFCLRPTGRFAHSAEHIAAVARRTGWKVCRSAAVRLRREGDGWIDGRLFFLAKDLPAVGC
jgi:predicted TPR repeat methyltransferase